MATQDTKKQGSMNKGQQSQNQSQGQSHSQKPNAKQSSGGFSSSDKQRESDISKQSGQTSKGNK